MVREPVPAGGVDVRNGADAGELHVSQALSSRVANDRHPAAAMGARGMCVDVAWRT